MELCVHHAARYRELREFLSDLYFPKLLELLLSEEDDTALEQICGRLADLDLIKKGPRRFYHRI